MRYLLAAAFMLAAATSASAQGSIAIGTPITFATPATISAYQLAELTLRPGANAQIVVVIAATSDLTKTISFDYPRDCGSFGGTTVNGVFTPNPPACPNRDTSAEIDALITTLNTINLSTRSLWRRIFDNICADFPSKFPGGCTVQ